MRNREDAVRVGVSKGRKGGGLFRKAAVKGKGSKGDTL